MAISVNNTAFSFFIKGSHSHMKNNTDYLDTPVTFERLGIFGCGFQQTYPMNILFRQTKKINGLRKTFVPFKSFTELAMSYTQRAVPTGLKNV